MSDAEFPNVQPGEWVTPVPRGYEMKCCDCGLVHVIDFRVIKPTKRKGYATIQNARYHVQFRAFRGKS